VAKRSPGEAEPAGACRKEGAIRAVRKVGAGKTDRFIVFR
jgi:hypothetical protein